MSGPASPAGGRDRAAALRRLDRVLLPTYTILALGYLMVPIVVMIVFSFNDPPGKFNFVWGEFSLDAWRNPLARPGLGPALAMSLAVAFISTVIATALGTLIGLALTRYSFRGRGGTNLFIFIPMATPEIVLGASLLTIFVSSAQEPFRTMTGGLLFPLSPVTITIAHIMFNISFVVVTVRARMQGFDRNLEEAAMDLGANEWTTFWRVTFPLIFPGILAAGLLAFSLSIDDFIISYFVAGTYNTFPIWIWGSIRNNLPPQVNVIGTIIFGVTVSLALLQAFWGRRSARS